MIEFILPLPPTTNSTYRTKNNRWYKSKRAKLWEEEAGWKIKLIWKQRPICSPVKVDILFLYNRRRDVDGGVKLVLDALEHQGVIKNDMLVEHLIVKKEKTTKNKTQAIVKVEKTSNLL